MTIKLISAALLAFAIAGCAFHGEKSDDVSGKPPAWVYAPSGDGYIGGVGVCGSHIKGRTGQRELAVSRAIDDIARQMGVTVDSVLKTDSRASAAGSDSYVSSYSVHTVSGAAVSAVIVETWTDPATGELYVYMQVR